MHQVQPVKNDQLLKKRYSGRTIGFHNFYYIISWPGKLSIGVSVVMSGSWRGELETMASDNDVTPEGPHFVRICGFKVFSDFTSTHAWYHCCEGFLLFFMFFSLADGKHVQRQRNLLLRRLLYLRCLSALPPQPNGDWRIFFLSSNLYMSLIDSWYCCFK